MNTVTEVLIFNLNGTKCGIEVPQIKEIIRTERITVIPNTPDFIEGVINLRGQIITIINLRKRLGMEAKGTDSSTYTVILEGKWGTVGLIVDDVSEVAEIPAEDVTAIPSIEREKFFKGVGKLPDESLVLLIDPEKILHTCSLDASTILNLLHDPIIIHDGKKILFANQKALDYFRSEEVSDIIELIHPDYRHSARNRIERALRGENVEPAEELFVMPEGKKIWFEVSHNPIPGENIIITSVFRDVTDKKLVEQKNTVDVIGVVNRNGAFVYANPQITESLGVSPVGKFLSDVLPSDTSKHALQSIRNAINGNKIVVSQDGNEGRFIKYYIPLNSADEKHCLILSQEKTDFVKQRMLLRKAIELNEMMAKAKNREELVRKTEEILANYKTRISDHPEDLSFAINHNGRRYGHLNVKSDLDDDEKYMFRILVKNLGFALKSIEYKEEKEKLLEKLSENIEVIAYLVDRIRNPLAAIMGYAEFIENKELKQKIVSQVERVVDIISKLDVAWINSEEVLEKITN